LTPATTLKKRRDFLVHRGMLAPKSHGQAGTTEGTRIKMTLPFPVAAHESSDEATQNATRLGLQIVVTVSTPCGCTIPNVMRLFP
jgi:hypothetical protein